MLVAGPGDAELVRQALESDTDDLRMAGLFAVSRIDPDEISLFEPVATLATHSNVAVRVAVASALPALCIEANLDGVLAVLEDLIQDEVVEVRIAALDAAEKMEGNAVPVFGSLRRAATDPHLAVKITAIRVSCAISDAARRPELALPIAMAAIDDLERPVRIAAAMGLGRLRQGALFAFDRLLTAADDPAPEVRAAAMGAMQKVDATRAWPRCLQGIDDPDGRVVAVAGACLRGARGETVDELIARFKRGGKAMERAMAIILAGADPIASVSLSRAARSGDPESRGLLAYSLWHLSRRSGPGMKISRWEEKGIWNRHGVRDILEEVTVFTAEPANLESAHWACAARWGGQLVSVDEGDSLACLEHGLGFAEVGIRTVVTDTQAAEAFVPKTGEPGSDLTVEYQAIFSLAASNELGLQVAMLQMLEDAGCEYLPDRLPENAACSGPGGEVQVRLIPGTGIAVIKPLHLVF
ncbi:MAG: hypothetical protein GY854_32555 [Deltaproteobacteria bacterium]|nr:hypothetical protein [Deltaproteobacteria bacterium]